MLNEALSAGLSLLSRSAQISQLRVHLVSRSRKSKGSTSSNPDHEDRLCQGELNCLRITP